MRIYIILAAFILSSVFSIGQFSPAIPLSGYVYGNDDIKEVEQIPGDKIEEKEADEDEDEDEDETVIVLSSNILNAATKKFALLNQDNEPVVLDSLIGKPLVMSFIFTRCPLPNMCPLIMKKIVNVQKELNKEYKDKVFFAIMTYDPEYDTPEVLKEYGKSYGVDYDNLMYLTGSREEVNTALNHFRVYFKEEAPGQIAHTLETMVMDEKGVIKKIFATSIWHPKSVITEVKNVIKKWESQKTSEAEKPAE